MGLGKVPGAEDEEGGDGVFAEINITPLTDIFLVLLIIFMVTSTLIVGQGAGAQAGLKVTLPSGSSADITAAPTDLSVAVLADGRVVMAGSVVTLDELKTELAGVHAKDPSTLVIIQADEGVPHGKVVEVMELAKGSGLAQLAIGVRDTPR